MDVIDIIAAAGRADRSTEAMLGMVINELMDGGTVRGSYLPEGGVGYDGTESVSFSGGEQATLEDVYTVVRVSDKPLDLSSVTKIVHYEGEREVESDQGSAHVNYETDAGLEVFVIDDIPSVISVSGENTWGLDVGLWFIDYESLRVNRVEYTVVHTIDPKYICRTINIADYKDGEVESMIASAINNGGGTMASMEVGAFWQDVDTDRPIRVKMTCGFAFETPNCSAVRNTDGTLVQFCFSANGYTDGAITRCDVVFEKESDTKATVAVLVTAAALPA